MGTSPSPIGDANEKGGTRSITDTTSNVSMLYQYRVVAQNTVGYGGEFPSMTVQSISNAVSAGRSTPTNLTATLQAGPQVRLTWTDTATNETGFVVQRSTNGVDFAQVGPAPGQGTTPGASPSSTPPLRLRTRTPPTPTGWRR